MNIDPRMDTSLTPEALKRLIDGNPPRIDANGDIYTGAVRGMFLSFHEKTGMPNEPREKDRYVGTFVFPHNNIGLIVEELRRKTREFYPNQDPDDFMDKYNKNSALKDQALMVAKSDGGRSMKPTLAGFVPGLPWVRAKSNRELNYFKAQGGSYVKVLDSDLASTFYSGCWLIAKLNIYKSTTNANPGPVFGLQGAMKIADDKAFTGGAGAKGADFGQVTAIEDPNASGEWGGGSVSSGWDS